MYLWRSGQSLVVGWDFADSDRFVGTVHSILWWGWHCPLPLHPIPVRRPFQIVGGDVIDLPQPKEETNMYLCFKTTWQSGLWYFHYLTWKANALLTSLLMKWYHCRVSLSSSSWIEGSILSHIWCWILGHRETKHHHLPSLVYWDGGEVQQDSEGNGRKHAARFGGQWDKFLPGVLCAYRNTPNMRIHLFWVMFGINLQSAIEAEYFPPQLVPTLQ